MRRPIPILIALLVVQLLLAVGLARRASPLAGAPPESPLLGISSASADRIVIESRSAANETPDKPAAPTRIEIARRNGDWMMPSDFDIPVSSSKVLSLLARLSTLQRGLPIATSASALERFRVSDKNFERRIVLKHDGKTLGTLYLGSSSGVRKTDARTASDRAVYAIDLASYEVPGQASDWFDADMLQRDPATLTALEVTHPHDGLKLTRETAARGPPSSWADASLPAGQHLNAANAEALARAATQLLISGVLGTSPKPEWQQQQPALALAFQDNKGKSESWTISQPTSGDYYVVKSSAHPWYFSVSGGTGKQLLDASSRSTLLAAHAAPARAH